MIIETWWPTQSGNTQILPTATPETCHVWFVGFTDHSYIRGMALAELEKLKNCVLQVTEDCVYLLLQLRRDILCKSNVCGYICALDVISEERYPVFLGLLIKGWVKWLNYYSSSLPLFWLWYLFSSDSPWKNSYTTM